VSTTGGTALTDLLERLRRVMSELREIGRQVPG
jgi:hypothetical protein